MPAFLVVDKPAGVTSHDIVAAVRAVTGIKKVGHTGTLDPFATGVLPLALGPATKLIQFLDESIKVYDATIALGASTDTGDFTGEPIREAPVPDVDVDEIRRVLASFVGERMQTPPAYSAVKKDGKPLYHYARKGQEVSVPARPVTIHEMELVSWEPPSLRILITCSRGTYARVLADEVAEALGSAGHLSALARSRSGPFWIEDAVGLDEIAGFAAAEPFEDWQQVLMSRRRGERIKWNPKAQVLEALRPWIRRPLDVLTHLPLADVGPVDADRVRNGGDPPPHPAGGVVGARYLVVSGADLVAIAEATPRGPRTLKVIPAT